MNIIYSLSLFCFPRFWLLRCVSCSKFLNKIGRQFRSRFVLGFGGILVKLHNISNDEMRQ